MPDDLLSAMRRLDSNDASDVLENDETVGDVFPEETRVFIQDNSVGYRGVLGDHWELNATVTDVCVKDSLQTALVANLTIVHCADALGDWHNLGKFKFGEQL